MRFLPPTHDMQSASSPMNIDLAPTIAAILEGAGFTAHKQLGKRTFGSVYHCTTADGKDIAIKVVTDDQEREMTAIEAEIMTLTRPHPNIIPLISFEEYSECSLMALPLAAGGDTLKLMQERSLVPLPFEDARSMFIQLVDAVSHMHKEGFVHRDIKCENVLLAGAKRRTVQLADFGFATRWSESSQITEPWGSLHYSSPEIVSHLPYMGPEVDVWSLGVVLYAWCTGRLPFSGNGEAEIAARINAGSFVIPTTLSSDLADLIARMLTPDPRKRITTADIKKHTWCAAHMNAVLRNCHMERCPSDPSVLVKHQQQRQLKADGEAEAKERNRSTSLAEIAQPSRLAKVGAHLARAFRIEKK